MSLTAKQWEKLFWQYADHVGMCEGSSFLWSFEHGLSGTDADDFERDLERAEDGPQGPPKPEQYGPLTLREMVMASPNFGLRKFAASIFEPNTLFDRLQGINREPSPYWTNGKS